MNNSFPEQTPSTISNLLLLGGVLSAIFVNPAIPSSLPLNLAPSSYQWGGPSSTYQPPRLSINNAVASFEETMTHFYTTLRASQQPLGSEFEKILYDNLWDLYQS